MDNRSVVTSTRVPTQEHSMTSFDVFAVAIVTTLNNYYTPILVLLGCIGNIMSIYVFVTSKLRVQSTSLYLSVLAISDTIFLLQLLPPWLNGMSITSLFHRRGFCQVFVYSTYVACCLSAWLVVAFTVERFVAVIYPLRRNIMCTVARAKLVILFLVVASMLTNLPMVRYASPSTNDCNIDAAYMVHAARFNLADTLLSFWFPMSIIVVLNIRIMCGVYRLECERRALQAAGPPPQPVSRQRGLVPASGLPPLRSQHRVTRMLLIVSTVFVFFNLPAYTMRLIAYAYNMSSEEYSGRWAAVQQLALIIFNTNFGINFILYCLTGQNFRRELCQVIPCRRARARCHENIATERQDTGRASYSSGVEQYTKSCSTDRRVTYNPGQTGSTKANGEGSSPKGAEAASARYKKKWVFKNPKQSRQSPVEEIEMQEFGKPTAAAAHSHSAQRTAASSTAETTSSVGRSDEPQQTGEPTGRRVPFNLFPLFNLMRGRRGRRPSSDADADKYN